MPRTTTRWRCSRSCGPAGVVERLDILTRPGEFASFDDLEWPSRGHRVISSRHDRDRASHRDRAKRAGASDSRCRRRRPRGRGAAALRLPCPGNGASDERPRPRGAADRRGGSGEAAGLPDPRDASPRRRRPPLAPPRAARRRGAPRPGAGDAPPAGDGRGPDAAVPRPGGVAGVAGQDDARGR